MNAEDQAYNLIDFMLLMISATNLVRESLCFICSLQQRVSTAFYGHFLSKYYHFSRHREFVIFDPNSKLESHCSIKKKNQKKEGSTYFCNVFINLAIRPEEISIQSSRKIQKCYLPFRGIMMIITLSSR